VLQWNETKGVCIEESTKGATVPGFLCCQGASRDGVLISAW
jgi:hypothetical protein